MRLIGGIDTLLRSLARTVKEAVARGENRLLKGHPVFTVWNAARVLALAVLLSIGAVMYFDMASEPTNTEAHPRVAAPPAVDSETALAQYMLMSGDDQRRYSFQHEPGASASPQVSSTADKFCRGIADEHNFQDNSTPHHSKFIPTEDWESDPLYSQCGTVQARPDYRSSFAERFPNGSLSED